jgi:hypothetical protein
MAEEGTGQKPGIKDLFGLIRKSPALMITVIAGILLVAYLLIKYGPSAASGTSNTQQPIGSTNLAPSVTSQGSYYQPPNIYIEQPTSNPISAPVSTSSGYIPPVSLPSVPPSYYQPLKYPGTIPANSLPAAITSITGTTPSVTYDNNNVPANQTVDYGTIRARYSLAAVSTYDKNTPGGIPVRSTPGGKQTGVDPFGSQVQISGPAVTGASNLPGTSAGSNLWYPISSGGYISAADIASQRAG